MIILNEKAEAEKIIATGEFGDSLSDALSLIARYYYSKGLSSKNIYSELDKFMQENVPDYNPVLWKEMLDRKVKKAEKHPLTEIDNVVITKAEIETIRSLKSLRLERLAFTLLCIAKFGNRRNPDSNGWVCRHHKEIFKLAAVPATNMTQALMLNELYEAGMIGLSKKVTNTNIRVLYINDDSEVALAISDFRELGYEYMNYIGKNRYIRCAECGRLVPMKTNNKKYCKNCAAEVQSAQKAEWQRENR